MSVEEFIAILTLVTICAAMRDAWSLRVIGVGWWEWHIPNWIALYVLPTYVLWRTGWYAWWWLWVPIVLALWALWKSVYKLSGGA